jgi:dihydrofolate reductase
MSKVFFSVGMSLDGFIAGPNRGPKNPLGDHGLKLHEWLFRQRVFRETHGLGEGGETGADNRIVEAILKRTGVTIIGKRMFDEGEQSWPEEAPFHTPVFVLTKQRRTPWERKGGTTFHFVNDGIESALRQARAAAKDKDVRIGGGASVIVQYLNAGLIDDFTLFLAPIFLGDGLRLFDKVDNRKISVDIVDAIRSPMVTHLTYAVRRA